MATCQVRSIWRRNRPLVLVATLPAVAPSELTTIVPGTQVKVWLDDRCATLGQIIVLGAELLLAIDARTAVPEAEGDAALIQTTVNFHRLTQHSFQHHLRGDKH
jgi:hypothetical protein